MTPDEGTLIASKYRLKHMLGKGGMGHIWLAEHTELGQQVAVKLVTDELADDESVRIRFKREAKAAAQLKSPHICHIYDFGMQQGTAYIVMELLVGEDLRDRLKRMHRLTLHACADLCAQLCEGLAAAHDVGIIHRDLKPGNIFLSHQRGREVVKIVDFGIAKETHSQLVVGDNTTTGMLIGSPRYMSPEQATGKPLDTRSDLWSAAVVLYQALTGERPFRGDHLGQIISEICAGDVDPPTTITGDLPTAIDQFFSRAFARDLDDRFSSADELADAFARAVRGEPLAAPPIAASPETPAEPSIAAPPPAVQPAEPPEATTQRIFSPEDASSPGVGMDTGPHPARTRSVVLAVAALVLAGIGLVVLSGNDESGNDASKAPSVPAAAPSPAHPIGSIASAAAPSATPATSTHIASPASSAMPSASAQPVAKSPIKPRPRPQPATTKPPPKPKTDPLFGLPEKK